MKNNQMRIGVIVVVLVILAAGGYLMRHQLKAMLGMGATPVTQTSYNTNTAPQTPEPTQPTNNSAMVAPSDNIYKTMTDAAKGKYMTDFNGMTLYTYDKDTAGVSNCTAGCLKAWPAYSSGATAQSTLPENISVITRTDGSKQFAWKGMPLYYYVSDTKAGDITGDGVGGVWHIVKM